MLGKRFFSLILIFVFLGITCASEGISKNEKPAQSIEELQLQLEHVLKNMHVPGMSIAIVHREGAEWIAGLGKTDLNYNRSTTAKTLFRIGSVSKGFVSLAVLMLANEGKLSMEDSLQKVAPEVYFLNKWEASNSVRILHLLENTTGWDDMHLREFAKDPSTMSSVDTLNYDHSSRISRWRPGTRMSYCNSGPAVAAYIVEKITGKSFEEYVEQKIFKPIGMQTATYFQPIPEVATTLYHSDGKTPHSYWNLLYRSIGSINASASDMANYLLFYLNRGNVNGTQILPSTIFNRMEVPTSTWAAKEGLEAGYGLNNYCTVFDGFVYHGHDGNLPGGITALAYIPEKGVGYFYSINSSNREAFEKIGELIRTYITRQMQKPYISPLTSLPEKINAYTGWYEPNSPRMELFTFLERLIGIAYIHFGDNKLHINSLSKNSIYLPVTENQFLYAPEHESLDPIPTLKLLDKKPEGQFIQLSLGLRNPSSLYITMKRIPTELAILKIIIAAFVSLTLVSIFIYAPFWILHELRKKHHNFSENNMRLWPLIAVLSLLSIVVIGIFSTDDFISRFGNLTVWSFSLFLLTIVFAVASIATVIALWRTPREEVRSTIRIYTTIITIALMISTGYLAYWGIIGLRTWL